MYATFKLIDLVMYSSIFSSDAIPMNVILRANECKIADVFGGADFI